MDLINMFQAESATINEKKFKDRLYLKSPILYQTGDEFKNVILLEAPIPREQLHGLKNILRSQDIHSYRILSCLPFFPHDSDLHKEVIKFYCNVSIDLKQYIPQGSNVLAIGRSNYAITQGDDLNIEGFRDNLLWKTNYFSPELNSYIYPIDGFYQWFHKDNFEYYWLKKQLRFMRRVPGQKMRLPRIKEVIVDDPNAWLLERVGGTERTAIDVETNTLNPWMPGAKIADFTLTFDGKTGYYLAFDKINTTLLADFLRGRPLAGTNLKFDFKMLHVIGGIPLEAMRIAEDTMHIQHLINEMQRKSLKSSAWIWTYYGGYDRELEKYKEIHPKCKTNYLLIPDDIRIPYAIKDPCVSWQAHDAMSEYMNQLDNKLPLDNGWSLKRLYTEITIPTVNMFVSIELKGVGVDRDRLEERSIQLEADIENIKSQIFKYFKSEEFNISSPKALGEVILKEKWPIKEVGVSGLPLTNDVCLERWVKEGIEGAKLLQTYREKETLMKTFVGKREENTGFWQYIQSDGLIHSSFAVMLAQSLRNKSRAPNLQNIPSHGDKAGFVRYFITPANDPDLMFLSSDYSGLQLRLATIVSGDETMRDIFINKGGDMHSITAYAVFCRDWWVARDENGELHVLKHEDKSYEACWKMTLDDFLKMKKTHEEINDIRFRAKAINFGFLFGAMAFTFSKTSLENDWTLAQCRAYVEEHGLREDYEVWYKRLVTTGKNSNDFTEEENKRLCWYWTVASDIRNRFFKTYPGLAKWIEVTHAFAKSKGFSRSIYGSIRRLPYLIYEGGDTDKSRFSGDLNISLNSPIQTMESVVIHRAMVGIHKESVRDSLQLFFNGQIHDAMEALTHRNEVKSSVEIMHRWGELYYPEYDGIPFEVESNLADYYGKDQFWDQGEEVSA